MRVLAADIGNAHTELAILECGVSDRKRATADDWQVLQHWRLSTSQRRTSDEWAVLVAGLVASSPASKDLAGLVVCSSVPAALHQWRDMLGQHFADFKQLIVEPGVRTGIGVRTEAPKEVGTDRIMNAVAAATLARPAIVVDFDGTATTFDVVDGQGDFVGGAIAPGIDLSLEALSIAGAQLRRVEIAKPDQAVARNTVDAIRSGLVFGTAAQTDGLVRRIEAELGEKAEVIATGHLAELVAGECEVITDHRSHLTLVGLAIVFGRSEKYLK